jgi:hypothetical protein
MGDDVKIYKEPANIRSFSSGCNGMENRGMGFERLNGYKSAIASDGRRFYFKLLCISPSGAGVLKSVDCGAAEQDGDRAEAGRDNECSSALSAGASSAWGHGSYGSQFTFASRAEIGWIVRHIKFSILR